MSSKKSRESDKVIEDIKVSSAAQDEMILAQTQTILAQGKVIASLEAVILTLKVIVCHVADLDEAAFADIQLGVEDSINARNKAEEEEEEVDQFGFAKIGSAAAEIGKASVRSVEESAGIPYPDQYTIL